MTLPEAERLADIHADYTRERLEKIRELHPTRDELAIVRAGQKRIDRHVREYRETLMHFYREHHNLNESARQGA